MEKSTDSASNRKKSELVRCTMLNVKDIRNQEAKHINSFNFSAED